MKTKIIIEMFENLPEISKYMAYFEEDEDDFINAGVAVGETIQECLRGLAESIDAIEIYIKNKENETKNSL